MMQTEKIQNIVSPPKRSGPSTAEVRQSKGEASRETILLAATRLATLRGLDGLSIGDLAAEVGMSKSGLYAHFKSKQELELATIAAATEIFTREVLATAMTAPCGVSRLRALANSFLDHLERHVFPGGCFFAALATELDTRPGPARDRVVAVQEKWAGLLRECLLDAQKQGEIDSDADVNQAAFEVGAMLLAANFQFVMSNSRTPLIQARKGIEHVLERAGVKTNR